MIHFKLREQSTLRGKKPKTKPKKHGQKHGKKIYSQRIIVGRVHHPFKRVFSVKKCPIPNRKACKSSFQSGDARVSCFKTSN